ncbi:CCA tRNA nucleotidyltransferase [Bacillus sp. PS06]|uniref:CCA tRNA nucleotidyltransferase n=1 Tax=Bacillus sp. PS06 TaxID=2764176 RepID=UPI00178002E4|nr:CCA tRNA nucleotidyltransferase [Bacillus sp. PS06]MBD8070223.1 CCA tRNA nucleotidyltransferase [Bacillus sp. PS06]
MFEPFIKPLHILNTLHKNGHEAYFVGGAVRDLLLKRPIGDVDIATSALPGEVMELFPRTLDVGIEHGTVIVLIERTPYEVTTFRTEEGYEDYRRPKSVSFIKSLSEDLKRRDFTMNAIAMDTKGTLIDPYHGQEAINENLIETVGDPQERFTEDALRMMRGIRFVSQLGFSLGQSTKDAMMKNGYLLKEISIERITKEFEKMITGSHAAKGLLLLLDTDLYKYLPNLEGAGDSLSKMAKYRWDSITTKTEAWVLFSFLLTIESLKSFLKMWKLPNKQMNEIIKNVRGLNAVLKDGWTIEVLYELGLNDALQVERVRSILTSEDVLINLDKIQVQYNFLPIKTRAELVVNGNDLLNWAKEKPGPWVSMYLTEIEKKIVTNELQNDRASIKEWFFRCKLK